MGLGFPVATTNNIYELVQRACGPLRKMLGRQTITERSEDDVLSVWQTGVEETRAALEAL